jgi:hypothetical protein
LSRAAATASYQADYTDSQKFRLVIDAPHRHADGGGYEVICLQPFATGN